MTFDDFWGHTSIDKKCIMSAFIEICIVYCLCISNCKYFFLWDIKELTFNILFYRCFKYYSYFLIFKRWHVLVSPSLNVATFLFSQETVITSEDSGSRFVVVRDWYWCTQKGEIIMGSSNCQFFNVVIDFPLLHLTPPTLLQVLYRFYILFIASFSVLLPHIY